MNILVTGTNSGIGHSTTKKLLESGNHVVGINRRKASFHDCKSYTEKLCDLSDLEKLEIVTSEICNEKDLDVLVLNAGTIDGLEYFHKVNVDNFIYNLSVNSLSCKAVIDTVLKFNLPKLVMVISSGITKSYSKGWGSYFLSKSLMENIINVYSLEQADTKFLIYHPHIVDTPMRNRLVAETDDKEFESIYYLIGNHVQKPSSEAGFILKIIMDNEQFESGSVIHFD